MERISVIVPIYKVEQYLKRCIESIIKQTYQNFELILVDDGSPDNCPDICDEYASKDQRIKVVHKNNGGLSDARNAGLAVATGEYIAFVDSDDWVSQNYLEFLLKGIKDSGADICECAIVRTFGGEKTLDIQAEKTCSYDTEKALELLIEDQVFHQYVWNKLYRRGVIGNIIFPKGKTNEDEFWTYQVFGNAKKVACIKTPLYFYLQREDSIMGESYSLKRLDALEAKIQRTQYLEKIFPELFEKSKMNLFGSCIYAGQMTLRCLDKEEKQVAMKKINDFISQYHISFQECLHAEGNNKIWFALAQKFFWFTCRIKNILKKGF